MLRETLPWTIPLGLAFVCKDLLWFLFKILRARLTLLHPSHVRFVPGPPSSSFLWGNIFDVMKEDADVATQYDAWIEKYGHVFKYQVADVCAHRVTRCDA